MFLVPTFYKRTKKLLKSVRTLIWNINKNFIKTKQNKKCKRDCGKIKPYCSVLCGYWVRKFWRALYIYYQNSRFGLRNSRNTMSNDISVPQFY